MFLIVVYIYTEAIFQYQLEICLPAVQMFQGRNKKISKFAAVRVKHTHFNAIPVQPNEIYKYMGGHSYRHYHYNSPAFEIVETAPKTFADHN